ncbi:hypothetical protein Htur_4535 (plasmid) [Haloterrigena turkmenica DSM 5511]|uniref:Uncharacterized protein n=1 Tax=Haloterrigena turkmenica (strain ATCC 51198 / DSM 5511 / JCM 9101 / NCIMB 13204 / VKM B-1734 / 4k) TaxID=543526 RepID=D2S1U2_HALTV|nr:hypothetical protein [Haloterrigena turkmenica]ADB63339.1 hypothetical protein Htur_4535 [Haloterrigena turkmenica DSM 5511]
MRVPGAVVWFDEAVEDLACRRDVLPAEDRGFRETIAAIMLSGSHPKLEDPDEVREDDIDLALVEAGLGVDVVPDDPDAIEDSESISASSRQSDREISSYPVDQSRRGT